MRPPKTETCPCGARLRRNNSNNNNNKLSADTTVFLTLHFSHHKDHRTFHHRLGGGRIVPTRLGAGGSPLSHTGQHTACNRIRAVDSALACTSICASTNSTRYQHDDAHSMNTGVSMSTNIIMRTTANSGTTNTTSTIMCNRTDNTASTDRGAPKHTSTNTSMHVRIRNRHSLSGLA